MTSARLAIGMYLAVLLGWGGLAWILTRTRKGPRTWD